MSLPSQRINPGPWSIAANIARVRPWLSRIVKAGPSPLMLAIALAIKTTSQGSIIFRQRRYGLDGEQITVYKFRTMTVTEDGDQIRPPQA